MYADLPRGGWVGAFKQTITHFRSSGLNRTIVLELAAPLVVASLMCSESVVYGRGTSTKQENWSPS
jgi:hypothetical protein